MRGTSENILRFFIAIILSATFVLFFSAHIVFAQDDETAADNAESTDEILDLGTLYVEETYLASDEVYDRPTAFATVLDPTEMQRRSLTLTEILDSVPGVTVRSFGGLGSLSTISIRGAGSENVLVLLDGIPLNPTGGAVDLSDIPLASLEKIEIIRGGGGAYSGAGAVGGVVRLTSLSASDDSATHTSARASAGSFGTLTGGFTWRDSGGLFHFELATSRGDFPFLNDNGTSFETSDDFPDTRVNNEFSSVETRYSHSWDLSESENLSMSGEWYSADKGIPGITTFPSPDASQSDSRLFLHSIYTDRDFENGALNLSIDYLRQSRSFSDPLGESTGVPLFSSRINNRLEGKFDWTGPGLSSDDVLSTGASFSNESLDADEYSNPGRDILALWLSDEWYHPSDAVLVSAIRCDWLDGDPSLSPRIGVRYPLNDEVTLRSNLSYDFRPPSFEELYRNEGLVIGNPDLASERTLGFDLGITHTSESLRFEAAYFNLQSKDLIDYLLISGYRWKPFNIGRARSSGFEISLDWLIDPRWELRGNFTRTNALDASGDPARQGMPLVGQPLSDLFTELKWRDDPWNIYLTWERRGASPITPSGTKYVSPSESTGIGVGYDFSAGSSLVFEVRNLFDSNLADVRGFPLPGRAFFLTWSGEW